MISAKVLTGLTKVQSTSPQENFQGKHFFWELLQPFDYFLDWEQYLFWLLFENPQSVCGNCISRVQKKFRESSGKNFWLFRRFWVSNWNLSFFWFLDKPFRQRCQTTFSSPEETFGEKRFFPKKVYSVFQLQTLSGNLWLFGRKLPHGCQISIIYVWRIIWRKSHIRKTVSFWSISVNKCSEGMNNLHPQVQKKIRGEIMISWNFIIFWSHQKSHDRNLDFWWEFSARLSKPHSQFYRKSLRKNLFCEETLFS